MSGKGIRDVFVEAQANGKPVYIGLLSRDGKPYGYMVDCDINNIIKWATPDIRRLNCELEILDS